MSEWETVLPGEGKRIKETPWQITPEGRVVVGNPGELHMYMEERLGLDQEYGYTPAAEGVISADGKIEHYAMNQPVTPEQEQEIMRQYQQQRTAEYQPLNDASPYDFSRPENPGYGYEHERPFIVHMADDEKGDEYPQVLVGNLGSLHQDIRDEHDIGPEMLRGYVDPSGKTQIEHGDEMYLPLVEKHMEALEDDPYANDREASSLQDKKWAYLNGEIGFGDFHHQIMSTLAERQQLSKQQTDLVSNLALANAHPANTGHDVAWGAFHKGYPVFWRTNVDRNAIWDAVQNARNVVEPPNPVTAGLKEFSEIDFIRESMIGSGGQLNEIQSGGEHLNYDGQMVTLPQATTSQTALGVRTQTYYAANVEKDGEIIGSVSVEVEGNTSRDGEHYQEVVIHDAFVKPEYRGSDVWLKLYRWVRTHWPHDRIFGEMGQGANEHGNAAMGDFFEKDNRRAYLGDDKAWEATGIGDQGAPQGAEQPNYGPTTYGAVEHVRVTPKPGVGYFHDTEDLTGTTRAGGILQIDAGTGEPVFHVRRDDAEPPGRGHGTRTTVGPFEQGDWRWGEHPLPYHKLISVEHGPHHYYALRTDLDGPVHLHKSDHGLRPLMHGELDFGQQVSTIRLRGREHPVYDNITVSPTRATEHVGAFGDPAYQQLEKKFQQRAPWYIDLRGNPVIGGWGQLHKDIGGQSAYEVKGDVNRAGEATVYYQNGHPHPDPEGVIERVKPAMRSAFGFGFHPVHTETPHYPHNEPVEWGAPAEAPSLPSEAPEAAPNGLRSRLKGIAFTLRRNAGEGDTGLRGEYMKVGAEPHEVRHDIDNHTGEAHQLPDGTWASWSGWPDAYRFIYNGKDYMEQPEAQLESGHGGGHPGLKQKWRKLWPGKTAPNPAYSGHAIGWHMPTADGQRGISVMETSSHANFGAFAGLQDHIERVHGPARYLEPREEYDHSIVPVAHPHGNIAMPPFPFDWQHYQGTGEMRRRPEFEPKTVEPGTLDFSTPAPAPGAPR